MRAGDQHMRPVSPSRRTKRVMPWIMSGRKTETCFSARASTLRYRTTRCRYRNLMVISAQTIQRDSPKITVSYYRAISRYRFRRWCIFA
jgi:hypothetical protein